MAKRNSCDFYIMRTPSIWVFLFALLKSLEALHASGKEELCCCVTKPCCFFERTSLLRELDDDQKTSVETRCEHRRVGIELLEP